MRNKIKQQLWIDRGVLLGIKLNKIKEIINFKPVTSIQKTTQKRPLPAKQSRSYLACDQ